MKSNRYDPRACEICGKMYKPARKDQRTCASPECTKERKRLYAIKQLQEGTYHARKRNYVRQKRAPEEYKPKPDTIVAIGYAERQIAKSLEKAGRIKKSYESENCIVDCYCFAAGPGLCACCDRLQSR